MDARCQRIFPLRMKANPTRRKKVQTPLSVALTAGRDESGIIVMCARFCRQAPPNYPEAWQPEEPRVSRPVLVRAEAQDNRVPQQRVDEKAAVAERRPERWREP